MFGGFGLERIERLAAIQDQTKVVDAELAEVTPGVVDPETGEVL